MTLGRSKDDLLGWLLEHSREVLPPVPGAGDPVGRSAEFPIHHQVCFECGREITGLSRGQDPESPERVWCSGCYWAVFREPYCPDEREDETEGNDDEL